MEKIIKTPNSSSADLQQVPAPAAETVSAPVTPVQEHPPTGGFMSRLLGGGSKKDKPAPPAAAAAAVAQTKANGADSANSKGVNANNFAFRALVFKTKDVEVDKLHAGTNGVSTVRSVDEFIPDEGIDSAFLEDGREVKERHSKQEERADSRYIGILKSVNIRI